AQLLGQAVRHLLVDAFELIEERDLFFLLVGMLENLLALPLYVRCRDLPLRALGVVGAGGRRKARGERSAKSGGQNEARAACSARDAGDDAEHGGQPVVGAVDR